MRTEGSRSQASSLTSHEVEVEAVLRQAIGVVG